MAITTKKKMLTKINLDIQLGFDLRMTAKAGNCLGFAIRNQQKRGRQLASRGLFCRFNGASEILLLGDGS
jgi:hypothetical protein